MKMESNRVDRMMVTHLKYGSYLYNLNYYNKFRNSSLCQPSCPSLTDASVEAFVNSFWGSQRLFLFHELQACEVSSAETGSVQWADRYYTNGSILAAERASSIEDRQDS